MSEYDDLLDEAPEPLPAVQPTRKVERAHILRMSEALARDTHATLLPGLLSPRHDPPLTKADADRMLTERVARARSYALWRTGAFEAGECGSPW